MNDKEFKQHFNVMLNTLCDMMESKNQNEAMKLLYEFEEYHYKIITTGVTLAEATKKAKATSFYKHYDFEGATSHIDDKYGIDVDDIYNIEDILAPELKEKFALKITEIENAIEDELHIGYLKLEKLG